MEGPTPPHRVAITEWENLDKKRAFFSLRDGQMPNRTVTRRLRPYGDMR